MISRKLILFVLLFAPALAASAAPTVSFSDPDFHSGKTWVTVFVAPDLATFVPNTSLAVELDFTISQSLSGATLNDDFWSVQGDNTAINPFTGAVAEGLVVDTANNTIFVAVESELYATPAAIELMTIELAELDFWGVNIEMGGRVVLPGTPSEYVSSRIAQNGVNYDGVFASCLIENCLGDFSGNGSVGNEDLTLLLDNWGGVIPPVPAGWLGTQPTSPGIDNDELTCFLDNWGNLYLDQDAVAAPEPGAALLAAAAIAGLLAVCGRLRDGRIELSSICKAHASRVSDRSD